MIYYIQYLRVIYLKTFLCVSCRIPGKKHLAKKLCKPCYYRKNRPSRKKKKEKLEPLYLTPEQTEFCRLFQNREQFIQRSKKTNRWITNRKEKLTSRKIIDGISGKSNHIFGARWSAETRYAVLDIDADGIYHNFESLQEIKSCLSTAGIFQTNLYQSSESGGWHLYVFFDKPISSRLIERALKNLLDKNGFNVSKGNLECFPSSNGLRIPLQPGFEWLDDKAQVIETPKIISRKYGKFLSDFHNNANKVSNILPWLTVESKEIEAPLLDRKLYNVKGKPKRYEWFRLGQTYFEKGLTRFGQRHEALLSVGYYIWFALGLPGLENAEARKGILTHWMETKHNGNSHTVNQNQWNEIEADIHSMCYWVPRDQRDSRNFAGQMQKNPGLNLEDIKQANCLANRRRMIEARAKISEALELYRETPSMAEIARATGCSKTTVKKHQDLLESHRILLQSHQVEDTEQKPKTKREQGIRNAGFYPCPQQNLKYNPCVLSSGVSDSIRTVSYISRLTEMWADFIHQDTS